MDFDARRKALSRLAESTTEAAERALRQEFETAAATLADATNYDQLDQGLDVIDIVGFRFSHSAVDALVIFAKAVDARELTYSDLDLSVRDALRDYHSSATLVIKAIQALLRLGYLETHKVARVLLELSIHSEESIRAKALDGLEHLSNYNINVFHGDDQGNGMGASPQMVLLEEVRKLEDSEVAIFFSALMVVLQGALSPTMKSASWSYKTLTLSRGATPATPTVSDVRLQSIDLLIRVYAIAGTIEQKTRVISALTSATRTESRAARRDKADAMFARDAHKVLEFFAELVGQDDLQIVQKIEHDAYWIFFHAISKSIEIAALKVREEILKNSEYEIYRTLIGFEGVFGDWQDLKEAGTDWKETDELRRASARGYVEQINDDNSAEWRNRILRYAETRSDDLATFPVFYYFLEHLAVARPEFAFMLVSQDTDAVRSFLIPLLRGLWVGAQKIEVRSLVEAWLLEGRNLYPSTKLFLSNPDLDVGLVKRLLSRASEVDDRSTLREAVSVAISNYVDGRKDLVDELLLPAIQLLSQRGDSNWVFDNWYRRELKEVVIALTKEGVDVVLGSLKSLRTIDYQAEEVLYMVALRAPEKVLGFLCRRLEGEPDSEGKELSALDAIPFELHKLNEPLSKVPELAVLTLRESYKDNYSGFIHGGARLLANIFPNYSAEFEVELEKLVAKGGESNIKFVLAVLRNYRGEPFVHKVCKEIIKSVSADSPFLAEVAVALESTGVVLGEFGMAQAYERKRQEVLEWLKDANQRVRDFAQLYIASLEQIRDAEQRRAEEAIALRKFQYGED